MLPSNLRDERAQALLHMRSGAAGIVGWISTGTELPLLTSALSSTYVVATGKTQEEGHDGAKRGIYGWPESERSQQLQC